MVEALETAINQPNKTLSSNRMGIAACFTAATLLVASLGIYTLASNAKIHATSVRTDPGIGNTSPIVFDPEATIDTQDVLKSSTETSEQSTLASELVEQEAAQLKMPVIFGNIIDWQAPVDILAWVKRPLFVGLENSAGQSNLCRKNSLFPLRRLVSRGRTPETEL